MAEIKKIRYAHLFLVLLGKGKTRVHVAVLIVYYLIVSRIITWLYPFNRYARLFGHKHAETLYEDFDHLYWLKCCQKLFPKINRLLPWKSACLQQSVAAFLLLRRKNMPTTIYFGMKRDGDEVIGHVWLRCGKRYITGGNGVGYTIFCTYALDWVRN
ncbi:TPA: lasso peptide biosynthesis B2 protein [Legionella pneumophila subsp. pneumophila]|nr:lasso peptide biosynthesis B2 protein [Legionella pneumophila]HAT8879802.1 lasso peptide biosynthesis B2 protein [Legionella pneumophila subsp. pneumophila]HAT1885142.1 lasso peptide biosynthesis B2 protein [Legionella pneumophila]HAT1965382.1 lasso peptide biosynthesis B2 protein [Legionella pneumophila]HAT2016885.1 lasso peptide biosynthesis B2 protein [Legionella pneumophila]